MVIPVSVKRPFRSRPKMVRPLAGITVRQKSERVSDRNRNQCPTETGMPVRQRPEYAVEPGLRMVRGL